MFRAVFFSLTSPVGAMSIVLVKTTPEIGLSGLCSTRRRSAFSNTV